MPRLTSGTGYGSWPTPKSSEPGMSAKTSGRAVEKSTHLTTQVALAEGMINPKTGNMWPTPTCQEVEHPDAELTDTGRRLSKDGKSSHSLNLADSVKKYPTPQANEDAAGTPAGNMQKMLGNDPRVRGETQEEWSKGALNPTWTEWLMGWPLGWTSMDAIEELDWRGWETDPADELPPEEWRSPAASEPGITAEKYSGDGIVVGLRNGIEFMIVAAGTGYCGAEHCLAERFDLFIDQIKTKLAGTHCIETLRAHGKKAGGDHLLRAFVLVR